MLIVSPPYQGRVQNQYGTLSGNVTGNSTISGTNIVYVGGSNITLQGAGDSVYIHGASGGGGSGSGVAISAGTASQANGVVVFSASNGVSFGLNAGTLTGSVQTNYLTGTRSQSLNEIQNPAADAVIFMNTRQLQLQWGSNFTTFTTNANRQGLFEIDIAGNFTDSAADLDGVHIHQSTFDPPMHLLHLEADGTNPVPLHITCAGATAALINRPIYYNGGSVPMVLGTSQSNSVQYLNANYVQGKASSDFQSTGAYLTTAAQVSHSHGNPTLALTNIAGSTASASSGLTLSLSYPASSNFFATSNNTFANSTHTHGSAPSITGSIGVTSNSSAWSVSIPAFLTTAQPVGNYAGTSTGATNASVTLNTAGLAISVAAPGGGGGLSGFAASNSTQTSGTVVLANSGGVSWSSGTQGIWGTVATNYQSQGAYLTTAALSGDSSKYAGTSTAMAGGSVTLNTSGISLSLPAYLTTAALSGDSSKYAGTSTAFAGGSVTLNTSGISLSLPAYLTTAALSGDSSKYAGTSTAFAGGSVTLNTSGISLSLPAYLTTARGSTDALGLNTAQTNVTWTANSGGLSLNAGGYAGTVTGATNLAVTANSSGVSVSGPASIVSVMNPYPGSSLLTNSSLGAQTLYFVPFDVTGHALSAYRLNLFVNLLSTLQASNSTGSAGYTLSAALYSMPTDSTDRIATFWSMSAPWKITISSNTQLYASNLVGISNSTQVSTVGTSISNGNASTYLQNSMAGLRAIPLPLSTTLTQGRYWLAVANSSASANAIGVLGGNVLMQTANDPVFVAPGTSSIASNANRAFGPAYPGGGTYSAVSAAFPASVPLTSDSIRAGGVITIPYFNFSGYTTGVATI